MAGCQAASKSGVGGASAPWGSPLPGQEAGLLPAHLRPEGIFELFAVGGLSPWESFYAVPEHGDPAKGGPFAGQQWWNFQERGDPNIPKLMGGDCGYGNRPLLQPFGTDSAGRAVNLGPFVHPLRDRPDLLARMRIWVMEHELQPHEAAIPFAVTGQRQGVARAAAFGAHIQRFYQERELGRTAPHSYAMVHSSLLGNRGDSVRSVGLHRASARPLSIRLGPNIRLAERLARANIGGHRSQLDALVDHYTRRYGDHLGRGRANDASGLPIRSVGHDDFDFARGALTQHKELAALLPADALNSSFASRCGGIDMRDQTSTGIKLAAHLLTTPNGRARYVQVMDGGLYPDPVGMGYDSHPEHVFSQSANITHALTQMASVINEPGENNPTKLDLDRHHVFLNTEFGRTPYPEVSQTNPQGMGTDHWPWGYVVVGFGGFIDQDRAGVVGAIGENGHAITGFTPTEHRCAMLLAMGIWPFVPEAFAVADVRGAKEELDAAVQLKETILGYST